ncbi:hypothetical protein ACLOJK_023429 [Asimina triloba]
MAAEPISCPRSHVRHFARSSSLNPSDSWTATHHAQSRWVETHLAARPATLHTRSHTPAESISRPTPKSHLHHRTATPSSVHGEIHHERVAHAHHVGQPRASHPHVRLHSSSNDPTRPACITPTSQCHPAVRPSERTSSILPNAEQHPATIRPILQARSSQVPRTSSSNPSDAVQHRWPTDKLPSSHLINPPTAPKIRCYPIAKGRHLPPLKSIFPAKTMTHRI